MATLSTREPVSVMAGDTFTWEKALSDYPPSDGWGLTYYIRGPKATSSQAEDDGTTYTATFLSTVTATLPEGQYKLVGIVSGVGTERYVVYEGSLTIRQNAAAGSGAYEARTHARKMLDAIQKMMEGNATREEEEYRIQSGGTHRLLRMCSKSELIKFYQFYKQQVQMEESAERVAQGLGSRRRILTRFTTPT